MKLKEFREKHGYTQKNVSDQLGCSSVVYSRYESGAREPSIETLAKLADLYGVTIDEIVNGSAEIDMNTSDGSSKKYKFKRCREANGYTQEQLAEKLHTTASTIEAWEKGGRTPTITQLLALADLYNVTTDYLLGRTPLPRDSAMRAPMRISKLQKEPVLMFKSTAASPRDAVAPNDDTITVSVAQLDNMIERKVQLLLNKKTVSGPGVYLQKADGSAQWVSLSGPMEAELATFEPRNQRQDMIGRKHTFKKTKIEK